MRGTRWVRGKGLAVLSAFVLGAMLMAAVPVMAGNGDNMRLGMKNSAGKVTKLVGRNGMLIRSSKSIPLRLESPAGIPPLKVNRNVKVDNLNADLLDGQTATDFYHDWAGVSNDNIDDDIEWSETTKTLTIKPGGGTIHMAGAVDFYNSGSIPDWVQCAFYVNGTTIEASSMRVYAQSQQWATCSTVAWFSDVAGDYEVKFLTSGASVSWIELDHGMWWAETFQNQ